MTTCALGLLLEEKYEGIDSVEGKGAVAGLEKRHGGEDSRGNAAIKLKDLEGLEPDVVAHTCSPSSSGG